MPSRLFTPQTHRRGKVVPSRARALCNVGRLHGRVALWPRYCIL
jgi:hypothetical protein